MEGKTYRYVSDLQREQEVLYPFGFGLSYTISIRIAHRSACPTKAMRSQLAWALRGYALLLQVYMT